MYNNKIVVYTSGTFDMFHSNHLKMIEYARGLGDTLIVGVSTDELVASYKNLPIIPFEERIAIIKALKYPDIVIPQHSLDHTEIVKIDPAHGPIICRSPGVLEGDLLIALVDLKYSFKGIRFAEIVTL